MKYLDKYLTAIFGAALLVVGFIIGTKFARPETTINFDKVKTKRSGTINISTDVEQEDIKPKRRLFRRKEK